MRDLNDRRIQLLPDDDVTLKRVNDALWTISEQYTITRALGRPDRPLRPLLLQKLGIMLSGAEIEDEDRNPLARNTQFELYVRAVMVMGDVPVRLEEPDLRIWYVDLEAGIAVKRVRSMSQLMGRVDEAVDQIETSGVPGIVAVNVDLILKAFGTGTVETAQLDERLAVLQEVDARLAARDSVLGSLIVCRDAEWRFGGERPAFNCSTWHRFAPYPRNEEQLVRGNTFWRRTHELIEKRRLNL